MDADIAIVDVSRKRTVRNADLHSETDFTLYEDMELTGWPVTTISRGEVVVSENRLMVGLGRGKLVTRSPA
jgi:dihydropyrimidinase